MNTNIGCNFPENAGNDRRNLKLFAFVRTRRARKLSAVKVLSSASRWVDGPILVYASMRGRR